MERIAIMMTCLAMAGCGETGGGGAGTSSSGGEVSSDAVDLSTTSLVALRGQWGKAFYVDCAPEASGSVWGTTVYTDDSSPCLAAVHAGLLEPDETGRIRGYIVPPLAAFAGSEQHGVRSLDYGAWPGAFQFSRPDPSTFPPSGATVIGWSDSATGYRGSPGTHVVWCPPGGTAATVWGAGPYTDDSSICTAAVHAGAITLLAGGQVTIRTAEPLASYPASTANGITTIAYGPYEHAFSVER